VAQQEGPGVDEVDPVHGYHDDTVPPLKAPGQAVLDEERVREHKTMLLIPKEDRTLTTWTHLEADERGRVLRGLQTLRTEQMEWHQTPGNHV
jgi:hypothetical protein